MKSVVAVAAFAGLAAANWEDADPNKAKTTTTTTTTQYTWLDVVDPTTTATYWGDAPAPTTTTTTSWDPTWKDVTSSSSTTKPVKDATTTKKHTWSDYDPAKSTTTTTATWGDYKPSASTTTKPVAASSTYVWSDAPVDPASTWVDADVCSVVTVTKTKTYVWVPVADATTTSAAKPTWTDASVPVKPATTTTTTTWDPTWTDYPVDPTTTTTTTSAWADYGTTTTMSTATTSGKPKPTGAVCPADDKKTLAAGGSCGCDFTINCNVHASPDANSKFWQKTAGQLVDTLAACNKLCDENSNCEATLWVDKAGDKDYHLCWQTSGLGPVTGDGYAQISYKGTCSGKCAASY